MTHKEIAKRMTKVELLEHVENLLGKIDDLLAERDRLRELVSEAYAEGFNDGLQALDDANEFTLLDSWIKSSAKATRLLMARRTTGGGGMSEPVTTTQLLEEISRQRAHIKDLQKLVTELAERAATEREECDRLREAIKAHRRDLWGDERTDHQHDSRLYSALQEAEG